MLVFLEHVGGNWMAFLVFLISIVLSVVTDHLGIVQFLLSSWYQLEQQQDSFEDKHQPLPQRRPRRFTDNVMYDGQFDNPATEWPLSRNSLRRI